MVYFLYSKLRGWGKRPAIRPQTQLCGVALIEYIIPYLPPKHNPFFKVQFRDVLLFPLSFL